MVQLWFLKTCPKDRIASNEKTEMNRQRFFELCLVGGKVDTRCRFDINNRDRICSIIIHSTHGASHFGGHFHDHSFYRHPCLLHASMSLC